MPVLILFDWVETGKLIYASIFWEFPKRVSLYIKRWIDLRQLRWLNNRLLNQFLLYNTSSSENLNLENSIPERLDWVLKHPVEIEWWVKESSWVWFPEIDSSTRFFCFSFTIDFSLWKCATFNDILATQLISRVLIEVS